MAAFRRVKGDQAGPDALGILIPPGRRTIVIVRPRSLSWDLLPLCPGGGSSATAFFEIGPGEAAEMARELRQVFEQGAGSNPIRAEPLTASAGAGYEVRAAIGSWSWIACQRAPGQPYRSAVFSSLDEALDVARSLGAVLCPNEGANQQLYFNTHHFSR
jgi:hypothetical protein